LTVEEDQRLSPRNFTQSGSPPGRRERAPIESAEQHDDRKRGRTFRRANLGA